MAVSKKAKKIVLIIVCVLVAAFLIFNIAWFFLKYMPYEQFKKGMTKVEHGKGTTYTLTEDDITYWVKMPGYLGWESGFIGVTSSEPFKVQVDEATSEVVGSSGMSIELFIWPQVFGETRYGVDFMDYDFSMQTYADENGNYIPDEIYTEEENAENEQLFEEYREEIDRLYQAAKKRYDFK